MTVRYRFWCVYTAAWTPYAVSYYVLFHSLSRVGHPLLQTAYNIVPAAALGASILPWSKLFSWGYHRRWWFYPAQLGSAILYSVLWAVGVLLAGSVGQALETHHFRMGYFSSYALQWQFFSGLMIYGNIAGVLYVIQINERLREEQRRREAAESLYTAAELAALRAQLHPHFLFNALNSIMALAGPEQPRTMQAIAQLAGMLRYTLHTHGEGEGGSLRQELDFTEQYLALESLRLGERLRIRREIAPEALRCRLPPLTLQPLVENALRHGISPKVSGGLLSLSAWLQHGALHLQIEDDGVGADLSRFAAGDGVGLHAVRQRLSLFTQGAAAFEVRSAPGHGCLIRITLPQNATEDGTLEEDSWSLTA